MSRSLKNRNRIIRKFKFFLWVLIFGGFFFITLENAFGSRSNKLEGENKFKLLNIIRAFFVIPFFLDHNNNDNKNGLNLKKNKGQFHFPTIDYDSLEQFQYYEEGNAFCIIDHYTSTSNPFVDISIYKDETAGTNPLYIPENISKEDQREILKKLMQDQKSTSDSDEPKISPAKKMLFLSTMQKNKKSQTANSFLSDLSYETSTREFSQCYQVLYDYYINAIDDSIAYGEDYWLYSNHARFINIIQRKSESMKSRDVARRSGEYLKDISRRVSNIKTTGSSLKNGGDLFKDIQKKLDPSFEFPSNNHEKENKENTQTTGNNEDTNNTSTDTNTDSNSNTNIDKDDFEQEEELTKKELKSLSERLKGLTMTRMEKLCFSIKDELTDANGINVDDLVHRDIVLLALEK